MQQPTVLCVESAESGFTVSNKILQAGIFRTISVTNPETALKAFSAIPTDAAVFDCRLGPLDRLGVAAKMRAINASVPQFLVAPAEDKNNFVKRSGTAYVVDDVEVLAARIKTAVDEAASERPEHSAMIEQSRTLPDRAQEISEHLRLGVTELRAAMIHNSDSRIKPRVGVTGFTRITLSACRRCDTVVALTENVAELENGEREHQCKTPEALRGSAR